MNAFSPKPKRVFVIHGEDEVGNIFAQTLTEQGFTACAPYNGEQWAIGAEGAGCLQEGSRVRLEHKPSEGAVSYTHLDVYKRQGKQRETEGNSLI